MKLKNLRFRIKHLKLWLIAYGLWLIALSSCYSFTGSSLSPDIKTLQVKDFYNSAALVNPTLAQQMTIETTKRFLQRTTLKGTMENPHILIEGEIINYAINPTTISSSVDTQVGGQIQAAQNKLTISVKIHYENSIEPEKGFDRTYTDEATFSSDLDINQIEATQVAVVMDRIINKIFNDIVADW